MGGSRVCQNDSFTATRAGGRRIVVTIAVTQLLVNRSLPLHFRLDSRAGPGRSRNPFARLPCGVLGALCLATLMACTPHFDWRDYRSAQGFVATFPAKVQTADRSIDLDGLTVHMTMYAARIDDLAFVVGRAALPDSDPATLEKAQDAIARGLVQNIAGTIRTDASVQIPTMRGDGSAITARALGISGSTGGQALRMEARIAARGQKAYQILVVGPTQVIEEPATRDALDTFFSSVHLE
jgi:hypothetical protein